MESRSHNPEGPFDLRLAVVSHVVHYVRDGAVFAYAPYARELEIWAGLFREVAVAAPVRTSPPPGDCVPVLSANLTLAPQLEAGGEGPGAKLALAARTPAMLWRLGRALRRADAVHVRCPGNLGLLGVLLAPLFSRRLVAKYAGQWTAYPGESATYRLQKALLRSWWWRGPVTVYGRWPRQPANVVPFFTSVLTEDFVNRARKTCGKTPGRPVEVLYVGRLSAAKNLDALLGAMAVARDRGADLRCTIVGEGPERGALESQARQMGLAGGVAFTGGVAFEGVIGHLERSDVLVLASETEGWPKAIAEGMAFGLVCIGSNRGLVPQMLGEGRGLVVEPRDVEGLAAALAAIARAPEEYRGMRARAAEWAQQFSIEGLRRALRKLLLERWRMEPPAAETTTCAEC